MIRRLLSIFILTLGVSAMSAAKTLEKATFAGGCFWCMEPPFEQLEGVTEVTSGYTGGTKPNPTYEDVSSGASGHTEAIRVTFDPQKISYEKLLEVFWRNVDPTQEDGQFADKGTQYRTAIFFHDESQKKLAEKSKTDLIASKIFTTPIVTSIEPASQFYPAEDYHQNYHKKNPLRYKAYRVGSGREGFLKKTWGPKK